MSLDFAYVPWYKNQINVLKGTIISGWVPDISWYQLASWVLSRTNQLIDLEYELRIRHFIGRKQTYCLCVGCRFCGPPRHTERLLAKLIKEYLRSYCP